jgi:TonB family protein
MQALHWGMSPEQVRQLSPQFEAAPVPNLFPDPPPSLAGSDIYDYEGCSFHRVLYFWHGRLSKLFLYSDGLTPCRDQIEDELTARYGLQNRTTVPRFFPKIETLAYRWSSTATSVSYTFNSPGIEILFADASINSRPEGGYFEHCESVAISFLPSGETDGVSDPVVDHGAVNLDCEYPLLAWAARWSGKVILHIRILEDGSVGNADLQNVPVPSSGSSDTRIFNEAALALARTRLRFHPAIKDGRPAATERDMLINFRVVRTVRFVT